MSYYFFECVKFYSFFVLFSEMSKVLLNSSGIFCTAFPNIPVLFWMLALFYIAHRKKIVSQKLKPIRVRIISALILTVGSVFFLLDLSVKLFVLVYNGSMTHLGNHALRKMKHWISLNLLCQRVHVNVLRWLKVII